MSAAKKRDIGDPLERAATTGKIGGNVTSSPEVQTSSSPNFQTAESPKVQTSSSLDNQQSGSPTAKSAERKQQTVYLPPALAKWLKLQAIEEEREISQIVTQALEEYRRCH